MFQTKVVEKIKTHNLYSTTFFQKKMCKNIIQPDRPQMTIRQVHIA